MWPQCGLVGHTLATGSSVAWRPSPFILPLLPSPPLPSPLNRCRKDRYTHLAHLSCHSPTCLNVNSCSKLRHPTHIPRARQAHRSKTEVKVRCLKYSRPCPLMAVSSTLRALVVLLTPVKLAGVAHAFFQKEKLSCVISLATRLTVFFAYA